MPPSRKMRLVFLTLSIDSIQNLQDGEILCFAYPYVIIELLFREENDKITFSVE